ncbi:MAG TPA: hypothetical protein VE505_13005, partial [Vicinamibacterales bacterium]|nr:hypothetical protein [Vicinamibacterales bacterium]
MSQTSCPSPRPRILFACIAMVAAVAAAGSSGVAGRTSAREPQPPASGVPRAEHPRPDFMRADWATLNGRWEFEFDDQDAGMRERWFAGTRAFGKTIVVPYTFQSKLSGIGDTAFHDVVWYRRTFA